ncbi:MAG: hypothetical protein WCE23_01340 [Candidatus Binatus sp.]|uniref:hypothetical protein n=1 Tax=Candidatus Binatus sp. TaxID=2811406 RepID=UPI003C77C2C5
MKTVSIKDFYVDMNVKNNGVEFDVSDDGHIGDLFVTKTGIIWCEGKTSKAKGRTISWQELRDFCKNNP